MAINLAQKAQNFTNRGRQALETGRFDLAMEMLMEAVQAAPDVLETRKLLRIAQIGNFKRSGKSNFVSKISNALSRGKISQLSKKNAHAEALLEAEKLLCQNPLDADNMECAVAAAESAGKPELAVITIEAAYECSNGNAQLLERVAQFYMKLKAFDKARDAYQKLSAMKPGDQRVIALLKNAEARATMNAGWEQTAGQKGGFQALIANKDQAAKLDAANKAVVTSSDAEILIAEKLKQIEAEPKNINARRALARLYIQSHLYEQAISCLEEAINVAGNMDPELDRMLSQTKVQYYDSVIAEYRAAGDEETAIDIENQKNQFVFDDLQGRVARYPNDLHLRYELGVKCFEYEYYDDALQHFQLAQKSPKDRLWALYYLALCFMSKGQTDMAVMQLETARDQLPMMDELKKLVVYRLGLAAEEAGQLQKAYDYYKDVYSADVGFEDLSERMLAVSKALKEQ
jgi:hypothetical protein